MQRRLGVAAAALGAAAVVLGAFGAHVLRGQIDQAALQVWRTAVEYQFWHVLALIAVAGFAPTRGVRLWRIAGGAFIAGITLFCGSLYALALGAPRWIGAITPVGGSVLIVGWLTLAYAIWCSAAND